MGDELLELVALAYEAGAEPERWPRFLAAFHDLLGDATCAFQIHDVSSRTGSMEFTHLVDPALGRAYAEHYAAINPWTTRGADNLETGRVLVGEMVLSNAELHRTEFYDGFLRPQQIEHTMATVIERERDRAAFITVQRSGRLGPFESGDVEIVERLMPHLRRALALQRRLGVQRTAYESLAETADRLPWGVLLLDQARRVLSANAMIRDLGRDSIARVLACAARGGGAVPRENAAALVVTLAPLRTRREVLGIEGAATAVFVVDPERERLPPVELLRSHFGLTAAEARLALALAHGDSLRDIAEATETSIATQRTHLKRVLAKTGTRRQGELIRLLLLLTPP